MRIKINVNDKSGMAYFPDEVRNAGFTGIMEGIPNEYSLVVIKPGASDEKLIASLKLITKQVEMKLKFSDSDKQLNTIES
jgi:hypothetical protein